MKGNAFADINTVLFVLNRSIEHYPNRKD